MSYEIVRITDRPELLETAARWFSEKWGIPLEEYTSSMEEAVAGDAPVPQWYLALEGERIGRNNGGCLESLCPCRMLPALFHRRAVIGKRRIWMIFYFSATGNSRWAALRLAELTGDRAVDMVKRSPSSYDLTGQTVGLVFPIYAWGVPEPVDLFVRQLRGKPAFAFAAATCGQEAGKALDKLNRYFPLDSRYTLIMPDNYVFWLEPETGEAGKEKVRAAAEKLPRIAAEISARKPVTDVRVGLLAGLKSGPVNKGFNRFARSTRPFYADTRCNGCGLCASVCPAHTIRLQDGKPRWGEKCYQCTACINRCPTGAIQYGKGTRKRGRYRFTEPE